jgi:hypothetical protein
VRQRTTSYKRAWGIRNGLRTHFFHVWAVTCRSRHSSGHSKAQEHEKGENGFDHGQVSLVQLFEISSEMSEKGLSFSFSDVFNGTVAFYLVPYSGRLQTAWLRVLNTTYVQYGTSSTARGYLSWRSHRAG